MQVKVFHSRRFHCGQEESAANDERQAATHSKQNFCVDGDRTQFSQCHKLPCAGQHGSEPLCRNQYSLAFLHFTSFQRWSLPNLAFIGVAALQSRARICRWRAQRQVQAHGIPADRDGMKRTAILRISLMLLGILLVPSCWAATGQTTPEDRQTLSLSECLRIAM